MYRLMIAMLVSCGLFFTSLSTTASGGVEALPDFVVDRTYLERDLVVTGQNFTNNNCAVAEGYVPNTDGHRLVKFSTVIANIGGPFKLGRPSADNPLWDFGDCHGHWHFKGYALYELRNEEGVTVASSNKIGFCVMDSFKYLDVKGGGHFSCKNQGLSSGWADIYVYQLDGQWVVIDGVPAGQYYLTVTVNPERTIVESDYKNNSTTVSVVIPEETG